MLINYDQEVVSRVLFFVDTVLQRRQAVQALAEQRVEKMQRRASVYEEVAQEPARVETGPSPMDLLMSGKLDLVMEVNDVKLQIPPSFAADRSTDSASQYVLSAYFKRVCAPFLCVTQYY